MIGDGATDLEVRIQTRKLCWDFMVAKFVLNYRSMSANFAVYFIFLLILVCRHDNLEVLTYSYVTRAFNSGRELLIKQIGWCSISMNWWTLWTNWLLNMTTIGWARCMAIRSSPPRAWLVEYFFDLFWISSMGKWPQKALWFCLVSQYPHCINSIFEREVERLCFLLSK